MRIRRGLQVAFVHDNVCGSRLCACARCLDRSSPNRWRWNASVAATTGGARLTVLPHEAVLLNSLRRLLSVVPQTEHTLSRWAGGPVPGPGTPSACGNPGSPATQGTQRRPPPVLTCLRIPNTTRLRYCSLFPNCLC
jgi:hypothetical protein